MLGREICFTQFTKSHLISPINTLTDTPRILFGLDNVWAPLRQVKLMHKISHHTIELHMPWLQKRIWRQGRRWSVFITNHRSLRTDSRVPRLIPPPSPPTSFFCSIKFKRSTSSLSYLPSVLKLHVALILRVTPSADNIIQFMTGTSKRFSSLLQITQAWSLDCLALVLALQADHLEMTQIGFCGGPTTLRTRTMVLKSQPDAIITHIKPSMAPHWFQDRV